MDEAVHHLQAALAKIHAGAGPQRMAACRASTWPPRANAVASAHAGRASPGLLEPIEVHAHNERLPLHTYATVTVRTPQLLVASVYTAEVGRAAMHTAAMQQQPQLPVALKRPLRPRISSLAVARALRRT